jgi:nucleotide-binding universal stress UspA family protein
MGMTTRPDEEAQGTPGNGSSVRVLVALDGTAAGSRAVLKGLALLGPLSLDVVALHVFGEEHLPRFWDQSQHAATSWAAEFLSRYLGNLPARLRLRSGSPAGRILEAAEEEDAAIIVLGAAGVGHGSRADVIRKVVERSPVPVLVVPDTEDAPEDSAEHDEGLGLPQP